MGGGGGLESPSVGGADGAVGVARHHPHRKHAKVLHGWRSEGESGECSG